MKDFPVDVSFDSSVRRDDQRYLTPNVEARRDTIGQRQHVEDATCDTGLLLHEHPVDLDADCEHL